MLHTHTHCFLNDFFLGARQFLSRLPHFESLKYDLAASPLSKSSPCRLDAHSWMALKLNSPREVGDPWNCALKNPQKTAALLCSRKLASIFCSSSVKTGNQPVVTFLIWLLILSWIKETLTYKSLWNKKIKKCKNVSISLFVQVFIMFKL